MLRDEAAADEVLEILGGDAGISSINAAEVLDTLRRTGAAEEEAVADFSALGADVVHPPAHVVLDAGLLRGRHYDHRRCPVSLADRVAAAHAAHLALPLATADPHLAVVVRAEGGSVHALPDSTGKLPT